MAVFDMETFAEVFEGMTVTVMASSPLRREVARLYAALRPAVAAAKPMRFPQRWEEIWEATLALQVALPAIEPCTGDDAVRAYAQLTHHQQVLLAQLAVYVWRTLKAHPHQQLWLVPALYSLRLPMLLEHQLFPVSIRQVPAPPWVGV